MEELILEGHLVAFSSPRVTTMMHLLMNTVCSNKVEVVYALWMIIIYTHIMFVQICYYIRTYKWTKIHTSKRFTQSNKAMRIGFSVCGSNGIMAWKKPRGKFHNEIVHYKRRRINIVLKTYLISYVNVIVRRYTCTRQVLVPVLHSLQITTPERGLKFHLEMAYTTYRLGLSVFFLTAKPRFITPQR
jgi:hypothetical protein